ncbi:anthranilate synthase component II [Desulfosporosinus youngiae]|uniref:Glutamine amidotransferase of anthranilate synthase or aminodeoxychorismate synthase n=1 Tax=Desulfosporosinus youngiae DSM 17734 TaxID=768710 RepID=H5Y3Y1_9FIRM|nr:aminodeoxychorismate/anthranilate synthase component II [Desulfosporosinus youngiae]EHQ89519.1 glutamine amidotransferase of anthranilate synthase or aminodeoxychorismate synthase [Desulfosporosinus youngiae DSM 17734]
MYLIIDHYDSFVYNLKAYFEVLNCSVQVIPSDKATSDYIEQIENLEGIIFSPGPKRPEDCEHSAALLRAFGKRLPILGVCLGHQLIGYTFGAKVSKGLRPMHGKITGINNYNTGVLQGLPDKFEVTRYHSLVIAEDFLPDCLQVDARADDGAIMAISHKELPIFGVQFHPEAILTQYGYEVLKNFVKIAEKRRREDGRLQGVEPLLSCC